MSSPRVAVAAPGPEPVQAAIDVGAQGGNAVDAAVTALLVATVTEPGIVSPMSGAFVNIWRPGGEPVVIDGNVEMPGRGRAKEAFGQGIQQIFIDFYGGITLFAGHGSVATPGTFAALHEASAQFGAVPWRALVEPAVHFARSGYSLGQSAASYLNDASPLFLADAQTTEFVTQGGGMPVAGQIMRSPTWPTRWKRSPAASRRSTAASSARSSPPTWTPTAAC